MNQHRRDLNTNELEKLASKGQAFLEEHKNTVIYAISAALVVVAVIVFLNRDPGGDSTGWSEFIQQTALVNNATPEDYGKISGKYPNKSSGHWALLKEAEILANQGVRASFSDRKAAISDLEAAKEKFEELLKKPDLSATVQERALFGLSRALESLSGGDTSSAVKAYEEFLRKFPNSIYADAAERQVKFLKSEEGEEFYAWFVKQNPKPGDRKRPRDGLPPGHPGIDPGSMIRLPDLPDALRLPEESGPTGDAPAFPEGADSASEADSGSPAPPPLPEENTDANTAPPIPE